MLTIEVRGTDALFRHLEMLFGRNLQTKLARALRAEAEIEMTEAKRRTPVKTGALRASGHVEGPIWERDDLYVRLVFGGPAAPYAVRVHEDLEAFHRVGQAKFLESTLMESVPYLARRVAERIAREMRGGGGGGGGVFSPAGGGLA